MKEKVQDLYSRKRQQLHKIVPLSTPFTLSIEPITSCNLKCNFCLHSLEAKKVSKFAKAYHTMSLELFKRLVNQLREFENKIKVVTFVGLGEPLLHKELPAMVSILKSSGVVETIQVVTNGIALTEKLSDRLIAAGLDKLFVSLNGLSGSEYEKTCGRHIDFEQFVRQLTYYWEHKREGQQVTIKTFDFVVPDEESRQKLHDIFDSISDRIGVERLLMRYEDAKISGLQNIDKVSSRFQSINAQPKVCSNPFYRLAFKVDGTVKVCGCTEGIDIGNINDDSITSIWNGENHYAIMKNVLKENYSGITEKCTHCTSKTDFAFEEDNLDPYAEEILKRLENK